MRAGAVLRAGLIAALCLPAVGSQAEPVRMATVAAVSGRAVTAADLAAYWFTRYPEEYGRTLDALIDERIVEIEARKFGIQVPAATLASAVEEEVQARVRQLRKLYGEKIQLASEVRKAYGVDVRTWRDTILRPRMHSQLLLERVVRFDTRRRDRVHVRVIVRKDAASAQAIAAQVRAGADFGLTAMRESQDPTAKRGGDLPWIARGDLAYPDVETRIFAARPGAIVGPIGVQADGAPAWHIYRIVRHLPAWRVAGGPVRARLEQDLQDQPFTRGEYERWRARAISEHAVQVFRPGG